MTTTATKSHRGRQISIWQGAREGLPGRVAGLKPEAWRNTCQVSFRIPGLPRELELESWNSWNSKHFQTRFALWMRDNSYLLLRMVYQSWSIWYPHVESYWAIAKSQSPAPAGGSHQSLTLNLRDAPMELEENLKILERVFHRVNNGFSGEPRRRDDVISY